MKTHPRNVDWICQYWSPIYSHWYVESFIQPPVYDECEIREFVRKSGIGRRRIVYADGVIYDGNTPP